MRSRADEMREKNSGYFFEGGPDRQTSIFTMVFDAAVGKHQFLRQTLSLMHGSASPLKT